MKYNRMRALSLFLAVALLVGSFTISASAVGSQQVTSFTASYASGTLTVTGQTSADVLAVAVMVYDVGGVSLLRLETFGVANSAFSGIISLSLSAGTYTVKAADYVGGGPYAVATFTVTAPSSSTPVPTPAPTPSPAVEVPLSGNTDSVPVSAQVTGTTAVLDIQQNELQQVMAASGSSTLILDVSQLGGNVDTATLSSSIADSMASAAQAGTGTGSLKIQFDDVSVAFDAGALGTLSEGTAEGDRIAIGASQVPVANLPAEQASLLPPSAIVLDVSVTVTRAATGQTTAISQFSGEVTIRVPYRLASGEDPGNIALYYINQAGEVTKLICTYNAATGEVEFKTRHFSVYTVVRENTAMFSDIKLDDWFYDAMNEAVGSGLLKGTTASTLSPDAGTNRAMLATVLYRLEGSPKVYSGNAVKYRDVPPQAWYAAAVDWASASGIATGYGDGRFGPMDKLSREQMATMLHRYALMKGDKTALQSLPVQYVDRGGISPFADSAMRWAISTGVMTGVSPTLLSPAGQSTRAQLATVVLRMKTGG